MVYKIKNIMKQVNDSKKIIETQVQKLPVDLLKYLSSEELEEKITSLQKGQPLQQKQSNVFKTEVMLVLIRLQAVDTFTSNIRHNMEISIERAEKLSKKVKQQIFAPVEQFLILKQSTENIDETGVTDGITTPKSTHLKPPSPPTQPIEKQPEPSLDVFKKRMEEKVHTKTTEETVEVKPIDADVERGEANKSPSSVDKIAADPYRETIE